MALRRGWRRQLAMWSLCGAAMAGLADGDQKPRAALDAMIRQLGAASGERRAEAVRGLIQAGPDAMAVLHEARGHRDPEVAARARVLYDQLADVPMFGARVTLRAEPARVAWNEPFDLHVTIETDSFACVIPFSTKLASLLPFGSDARQAGLVLDVADFLVVVGPDGGPIDPHVYDALDDPSVIRAVEMRAEGLNFGRQAAKTIETTIVPALNRGRARYRMLAAGTYKLRLAYEPEWDDAVLADAHAGRTESDWIEVEITSDAPPPIRAGGSLIDVIVRREGGVVIASVVNTYDLPVRVNGNLNGDSLLYARAAWVLLGEGEREEVAVASTGSFDARRLQPIAPGERRELTRVAVSELEARAVAFRYESTLCRAAVPVLTPRVPPAERRWLASLPAYLATGRLESEALSMGSP